VGVGEREYELIEAYYDNAAGAIEALRVHERPAIDDGRIAGLPRSRADQQAPCAREFFSRKRADGNYGNGRELVRQLRLKLEAGRIEVLTNTRHPESSATRAEKSSDLRQVGGRRVADTGEEGVVFRHRAVLRTIRTWCSIFQPGPNWGGCAVPTNQGDFVRLGIETGAMFGQHGRCLVPAAELPRKVSAVRDRRS